jgi:Tfp pilus assembly protein PilX
MQSKKGMALATVMAILLILIVIGASISFIAISHAGFTFNAKTEAAALSAARAGLSRCLVVSKTVSDWSGTNLVNAITRINATNPYPDPNNPNVYFQVSVIQDSTLTSNTALLQSIGFVKSGSKILKQKTIRAFIHWQFPNSLNSVIFAGNLMTKNGATPTINCGSGYVVVLKGLVANPGVSPCPTNQVLDPPTNLDLWPFPKLNVNAAISAAKKNNVNNFPGGTPPSGVVGHYFPSSAVTGAWTDPEATFVVNTPCTGLYGNPLSPTSQMYGMIGTNFFDVSSGVTVGGSGGNVQSNPFPCYAAQNPGPPPIDSGPNVWIVTNGNVTLGGNRTYNGLIIDLNGTVTLNGGDTINGAIFAKNIVFDGNAQINYDPTPIKQAASDFIFSPIVVVDSLWIGTQPHTP